MTTGFNSISIDAGLLCSSGSLADPSCEPCDIEAAEQLEQCSVGAPYCDPADEFVTMTVDDSLDERVKSWGISLRRIRKEHNARAFDAYLQLAQERSAGHELTGELFDRIAQPVIDKAHEVAGIVRLIEGWWPGITPSAVHALSLDLHAANQSITMFCSWVNIFRRHVLSGRRPELNDPALFLDPYELRSILHRAASASFRDSEKNGVGIQVSPIYPAIEVLPPYLVSGRINYEGLLGDMMRELVSNSVNSFDPSVPTGERWVLLSAYVSGDEVVIEVEDNSRGMSPEELAKYGEMGWRAPDVVAAGIPGTGIGAGSVLAKVAELGGTFQISSQEGVGTAARIKLPRSIFRE